LSTVFIILTKLRTESFGKFWVRDGFKNEK
jgi:hypothetical protein